MKEFEIANKSETLESLEKWRKLSLVLNASRRFRYVADTKKRRQAEDDLNFVTQITPSLSFEGSDRER